MKIQTKRLYKLPFLDRYSWQIARLQGTKENNPNRIVFAVLEDEDLQLRLLKKKRNYFLRAEESKLFTFRETACGVGNNYIQIRVTPLGAIS